MPIIFIFFGLRFMFFANDHEPIHVQVVKGKGKIKENAKFTIFPVMLIENNGLSPSELKLAEAIIEENKEKALEYFSKALQANHYNGEALSGWTALVPAAEPSALAAAEPAQ